MNKPAGSNLSATSMGGRGSQGGRLKSGHGRRSLPFVGLAAVGLVLACLVGSREARDLQRPRCSSGARRGRDGRSARTGSSLAPAHGFSALSLALRPVRDEPYGACSRSPGCTGAGEAWKDLHPALPEQQPCASSFTPDPDCKRVRLSLPARTVFRLPHRRLGRVPREAGPPIHSQG